MSYTKEIKENVCLFVVLVVLVGGGGFVCLFVVSKESKVALCRIDIMGKRIRFFRCRRKPSSLKKFKGKKQDKRSGVDHQPNSRYTCGI